MDISNAGQNWDQNEYLINGSKTFITNGQMSDLVILVAKTDPEAGAKGTSLILVETGTEGYRTAEVTLGGIDTDALSSRSMEAKAMPGLYAIGEAVDVTGWLGGYNFQWAWASGHAAGTAIRG